MNEYTVVVGVDSDKKKKRFEPGDTCTEKDFPKQVIKTWVKQGILLPMQSKQKEVIPKEATDGSDAQR